MGIIKTPGTIPRVVWNVREPLLLFLQVCATQCTRAAKKTTKASIPNKGHGPAEAGVHPRAPLGRRAPYKPHVINV